MIVLDASVGLELLRVTTPGLTAARRILREPRPYHVPHLFDVALAHVLRRRVLGAVVSPAGGAAARELLARLPLLRHARTHLLGRIWELRENLTADDAVYVALAESLGATLLTRDARLARAPGVRAAVEIV